MDKKDKGKTTLFVLATLGAGGTSTSMINLLNLLNEEYGTVVDILLFNNDGVFVKDNLKQMNVLDCDPVLWFLSVDKKQAFREKPLLAVVLAIIYQALSVLYGNRYCARQKLFKWRARRYSNKYSNIVAFQEEAVTAFCQYIIANNKIAWVHATLDTFPTAIAYGYDVVRQMYSGYDHIICVSKATRNFFLAKFPEYQDRTEVIYNPFLYKRILDCSNEATIKKGDGLTIITVGRFSRVKRFDKIPEIAEMLVRSKVEFTWYVIGDGEEYNSMENVIAAKQLENHVILTGIKKNPFPFIKAADVLVITSDFEAHPMVANEALILGTPVITTPYPSAWEIVKPAQNGIIADGFECQDIYRAIMLIARDLDIRNHLTVGAKETHYDNAAILERVNALLT